MSTGFTKIISVLRVLSMLHLACITMFLEGWDFNALHVVNNKEWNIFLSLCVFISIWYNIIFKSM